MKSVLLTGCAGFIGSHLLESLLQEGWRVHGVDKLDDYYDPRLKLWNLAPSMQHPSFSFHAVDLADAAQTEALAAKIQPDLVVHLAAVAGVRLSVSDPARYVRANVVATQNVLGAFCRPHVPLVFASSSSVYGNDSRPPFTESEPCVSPPSPYAGTKRACELLCNVAHHIHGLPITMLRFFTVYGPRQRPDLAIRKFGTAILRGREVEVFGDGSMARDFTHVSDIVRGIRAAMNETSGMRVVNIGNSSPVTVNELIAKLGESFGTAPKVRHIARPPGEMNVTFADTSLAERLWGWRPSTTLNDGLTDFAAWLVREEAAQRNP